MENKPLTNEQITKALSYVQEFLNMVPLSGYESHKRAVASIENLELVIRHINETNAEEKDGME